MKIENLISAGEKVAKGVAKDVTTSTALLIVASPIQAVNDTIVLEYLGRALDSAGVNYIDMMAMSNQSSIDAKLGVAAITYCGIGWLYRNLREVSRKFFGINEKTKERIQWVHDWIYTTAFSSGVLAGGYIYSEESNWWKIGTALTISAATQTFRGPLIGYSVDCYQDLLGFKECKRTTYPSVIKKMARKGKLAVAAGAVAISIGLMGLLYSLTPSEWSNPNRLKERQTVQKSEKIESVSGLEDIVK